MRSLFLTAQFSLTTSLARWRTVLSDLLCPSWRVMLILAGSLLLNDAIFSVFPGQGRLAPLQGLEGVFSSILAFIVFWAAAQPKMPRWLALFWWWLPPLIRWPGWRGVITMGLVIITWNSIARIGPTIEGNYYNDAITFVHADADTLLHGRNPYTDDAAFWAAALRWPKAHATPILGGPDFGSNPLNYPSTAKLNQLYYQATNLVARNGDFDPQTVHNYPAGIILMALPFVWAGLPTIVPLNALCFAIMLALVLMRAPRRERWPLGLALLLNPAFMVYVFVNVDAPALLWVLLAWHVMRREKTSAIFMGLACAVKQVAWFIAPFYLLEVARREGWAAALRRSGWLAVGFIVPNLPFIIAAPKAWAHSMLVPMTDAFFPLGFGPIALALSQIIPFGKPGYWTLLVLLVMGGLLLFQWCRPLPAIGLFLGLLPLWFSWRSPMNYFGLIPVLVAWIAAGYMVVTPPTAVADPPVYAEVETEPVPAAELELELAR